MCVCASVYELNASIHACLRGIKMYVHVHTRHAHTHTCVCSGMRRFLTASRSSSPPRKAPETEKGQVASSSTSAAHAASLQPSDETQDSSSCGSGSDLPPPPTSSTPQPVGFRWVEKEGDLFQADTSLAHCVSAGVCWCLRYLAHSSISGCHSNAWEGAELMLFLCIVLFLFFFFTILHSTPLRECT